MWSWTFCRLCPAKSCSLLTLPDITTNTQLKNSPDPDGIYRWNPSQWNGCTAGTPTRRESKPPTLLTGCLQAPRRPHLHPCTKCPTKVHRTRGANRAMFSYCPNNSSEQTESLHKGFNRKMQKKVTIRASEFVTSILLQGLQSTPNFDTALPQEGRHHTWPKDKWEASNPVKTDAPAESAGSQHALSYQSTPTTLTSQKWAQIQDEGCKLQHVYKCVGVGNGTKPTSGSISYFDPCFKEEGCGWSTVSGTLLKAPPRASIRE